MTESAWPVLSPVERRVLGVLIEKQKTSKSADTYPLTLNSLTAGCNQKSNRDPIMELDEDDIEEALGQLLKRGLVSRVSGGRVERWKHEAYSQWTEDRVEMAIIAELLLRGPQSEGDLRGRVSRMEEIESLETLRRTLRPMAQRGLVVYLTPAERRGAMLTHGFHHPQELAQARATARVDALATVAPAMDTPPMSTPAMSTPPTIAPPLSAPAMGTPPMGATPTLAASADVSELSQLRQELASLRSEWADLRQQLHDVQSQLTTLAQLTQSVEDLRKQLGLGPMT